MVIKGTKEGQELLGSWMKEFLLVIISAVQVVLAIHLGVCDLIHMMAS